jgi:hypothetical protein
MAFRTTHELHHRRMSRNLGLGLVLVALVALVFGLTMVKVQELAQDDAFRSGAVAQSKGSMW